MLPSPDAAGTARPAAVAVCGECLVDLVPDGPGRYAARPGGSPANTAVALARLGTPALLLARLSGDELGDLLRRHLRSEGVDLSRAVDAQAPTGVAVVGHGADGTPTYRFALDGAPDWDWVDAELGPLPAAVQAVHAGSLALARPPGAAALERFLHRQRAGATISIDPNLRPGLSGGAAEPAGRVQRWLALADVLKASTEDLALLHPGQDPARTAAGWARRGPALVVLTDGPRGLLGLAGQVAVRVPAPPVEVVDTVGAGDTVAAALLHDLGRQGLLGGRLPALDAGQVERALRFAARAAAVTCGRPGADPPTAAELAVDPAGDPAADRPPGEEVSGCRTTTAGPA